MLVDNPSSLSYHKIEPIFYLAPGMSLPMSGNPRPPRLLHNRNAFQRRLLRRLPALRQAGLVALRPLTRRRQPHPHFYLFRFVFSRNESGLQCRQLFSIGGRLLAHIL